MFGCDICCCCCYWYYYYYYWVLLLLLLLLLLFCGAGGGRCCNISTQKISGGWKRTRRGLSVDKAQPSKQSVLYVGGLNKGCFVYCDLSMNKCTGIYSSYSHPSPITNRAGEGLNNIHMPTHTRAKIWFSPSHILWNTLILSPLEVASAL